MKTPSSSSSRAQSFRSGWTNPLLILMYLAFCLVAAVGFGYIFYLFVTVVFLGGSNACPLNVCP